MFAQTWTRIAALCLSLLSLSLVGCGAPPQEGISIQIARQHLEKVTFIQLWVITTKLKNQKAVSCDALLKKSVPFDPKNFSVEDTPRTLLDDVKTQDIEIDKLKPGEKIFVAAGYAKGHTPEKNKPQIFGCSQAKIEAGKKSFITFILIPY